MCSSNCPTRDHETFGACLRAKSLRVGYCRDAVGKGDFTSQKKWDSDLAAYKAARDQGVQPQGTNISQVRRALDISDKTGEAYQA